METSRKRNNKTKKGKSQKYLRLDRQWNIPPIEYQNKLTIRRRFQAGATVSGILHLQDVLNQFLVATSATLLQPSIEVVRVKEIEMWSNQSVSSPSGEGFVTLVVEASDSTSNNFNSPPQSWNDVTNSTTQVAHLKKRFDTNSPMGSWHYADNLNVAQQLCFLSCSTSSTIDIVFEVYFNYAGGPRSYSVVVVGATPGQFYSRIPITSLNPVGVNVF
jgi:hypothetical protein